MEMSQNSRFVKLSKDRDRDPELPPVFRPRDPVSAGTHFAGFVLSILGMPVLLIRASDLGCSRTSMVGFAVFLFTMILLYGASASYHSFHCATERKNRILRKLDHISIFYLIAGSYTPICLSVLPGRKGLVLLCAIWGIALAGTVFKAVWITCPKWVSSVTYIGMGWAALSVIGDLAVLLRGPAFAWLLAEGLCYTAGGVIYAVRYSPFHNEWFGNHELFHCLVLAGSLCHYILVFRYVVLFG